MSTSETKAVRSRRCAMVEIAPSRDLQLPNVDLPGRCSNDGFGRASRQIDDVGTHGLTHELERLHERAGLAVPENLPAL